MKSARQLVILELIAEQQIDTQEDLVKALNERGYHVTQATVSRDMREMKLVKVATSNGGYRYAIAEQERSLRMLSDTVLSVESSGNIMVVKTLSGSAGVACEALDSMAWPEVIGTIAGDNTFFAVIRSESEAPAVCAKLRAILA